jgi:hypothetical protein
LQEINYINELVEYERAMAGQDDELDDEVWNATLVCLSEMLIKQLITKYKHIHSLL